ncbi:universal stress protein [Bacillus sp. FJAT-42315]|uniref:universal stress protein n=1 Tax=Bacillus sp. FJAT-42315 TaxID=2014077 RepID=UPI000BA9ABD5|nr:universal stress protein [Bacillus sp. FJAT-42315]PAQ14197.1 universal stress protein [Bacillaceae bacterium SAOS 7]
MYKRILLAVDGSKHSLRATEEAIKIASFTNDCAIDLVFVADYAKAKNEVLHAQSQEELTLARRQRLLPIEEQLKANNINYQLNILHGEPAPTIVDYANKENFDMTIIGSRGLNSLQEMVLGSVSHKVVKRVNGPVLIVK